MNKHSVMHMEALQKKIKALQEENAQLKKHQEDVAKAKELYLNILEEFPALIWRANTEKLCDYFNSTWLKFTGRSMAQEYGNGWAEGVHPEDLDRCFAIYTKNFDEREAFSMEYRLKNRFGEYRWILDIGRPYYDLDQSFLGYIGSCYDITQQKENEENLKILSITDPLTQVNNRLKLDSELELELSKAERYNIALTTILIDIDDFKKVNDTLGHLVGDSVLVQVACLLKDNIRLSDTLGRWGGEEFLIICPNTDQEAAKSISEKLRIDIENHKFSETLSITCSFGVANFQKGDSSHKLLKRTDDALYLAKKTGKNQVSGV